jgi:Zn-dependent protease
MPSLDPIFIISILIALSVHEWAHGFAADALGDPTARYEGRLTLNPLAHLDPIGTVLFLLVGFGWGKPVPINPRYFKHPKRDIALTALAGPFSNLILFIIAFLGLMAVGMSSTGSVGIQFLQQFFQASIGVNLSLMAFNLLPIAPLDGSKILGAFIPLRYEDAYEDFMQKGPWILLALLLAEQLFGFPFLAFWIHAISNSVLSMMIGVFG